MATTRITYRMAGGVELEAEIDVANSNYPQELAQARAETVRLFREGLVEIYSGDGPEVE